MHSIMDYTVHRLFDGLRRNEWKSTVFTIDIPQYSITHLKSLCYGPVSGANILHSFYIKPHNDDIMFLRQQN